MRALITGAAGFIGAHLFNALREEGTKVCGIDNLSHPSDNKVPICFCDVKNDIDLEEFIAGCDVVFHLAAQISVDRSISDPKDTINTNILGTQNVLELAQKYGAKVVFASSSEIYGSSQTDKMNESHPLNPMSPYGASKAAGDLLCTSFYNTYKQDVVIVRNFNTFGEYQSFDSYGGVIAKFVTAAINGEDLLVFGSGEQERDYMHVKDAIAAYKLSSSLPSGSIMNFGSGTTVKIKDLAHKIVEITNSKSKIYHVEERKGEVMRLCADISQARRFGFEPKTEFWKDLEAYIEWARTWQKNQFRFIPEDTTNEK